jgi:hypothetical protein
LSTQNELEKITLDYPGVVFVPSSRSSTGNQVLILGNKKIAQFDVANYTDNLASKIKFVDFSLQIKKCSFKYLVANKNGTPFVQPFGYDESKNLFSKNTVLEFKNNYELLTKSANFQIFKCRNQS